MRREKHIASVIGLICGLATFHSECQTNLPSPAVQTAVSNILRQLTNDEARAAFRARLAKQFQNQQSESLPTNVVVGWSTNGPAVFTHIRLASTNYNSNPVFAELNRLGYPTPPLAYLWYYTNVVFHHYLPSSLNNLCWTNFMAHTNGRTPQLWSVRQHPSGWPAQPPIVRWNTNCLMWGMKGLTGICPCWETEEAPGWRPITALTRRHGYTRGHDIGPDGFGTRFAGKRVWFVTKENKVVQATVLREVVRIRQQSRSDYTIVLFSQDLPTTIEPLRVTRPEAVAVKLPIYFNTPMLIYMTEQLGNVGNGSPGFNTAIMKAGDSGSPNMVPLLDELVFYAGRTTTGPTPEMQADMDELCRKSGLIPAKYQMQWVDLSAFPSY